jgi:hypothetical protein
MPNPGSSCTSCTCTSCTKTKECMLNDETKKPTSAGTHNCTAVAVAVHDDDTGAAGEIKHYEKENSSSIGCENWTFACKVARFNVSLCTLLPTFLMVLLFVVYMMASYQQVCCTPKSGIWNNASVADSTPTCGSQIIEGTTAYARLIATSNPETSADFCTWYTHSYAPPNPTPDQQLNSNNQEQKLLAVSNPSYAYWSNLGSVQNVALNGDCSSRTIDNSTIYGEERYDFLNDTCEGKIK